jgi:putative cardiolipin synthase
MATPLLRTLGAAACVLWLLAGCDGDSGPRESDADLSVTAGAGGADGPAWDGTFLGRVTGAAAESHPGHSGFLLLDRGADALWWRLAMADAAERTIDAQYFLWKDDAAGQLMMQRLLAAAERGVRVRVLIDDSMTESDPEYLALFDAYPNVEVRLYKPFGPRHKSLVLRWVDYVADLRTMNRRMHNKLLVVDGSVAFLGGRNIADEYFEYAVPFVFRSRDLLAVGPVARTGAEAFDLYWDSDWTRPITDAVKPVPTPEEAATHKEELDELAGDPAAYPPGFPSDPGQVDEAMRRLEASLMWGSGKLLVDAVPEKDGQPQTHEELDVVGTTLLELATGAQEHVHVQSAYLILLDAGVEALADLTSRGVGVTLATNSMASNNHLTAYEGYRKQRHRLLETGGALYEMRPDAAEERALFTEAQLEENGMEFGLHAKTVVFDRHVTFVGSFNLDPRSINLNTEMGLLVESEELAEQVAASIENDVAGENSWQVRLTEEGSLEWVTVQDGEVTFRTETEPQTSRWRRAEAWLLEAVPDDSQL